MNALLLCLSFIVFSNCDAGSRNSASGAPSQINETITHTTIMDDSAGNTLELATFGAGCFWCVEAVFQELRGVKKVESGYSGGTVENPTYREICTGMTGHAEVVQIHFNPKEISFDELLEVFWTMHDPTTLNRQGADRGTQYRSVVFYHSEEQKLKAEKSKNELASQLWEDPIVTEISPFTRFYLAEDYHQDYFKKNTEAPYCQVVIAPKLVKLKAKFGQKLKNQ